MSELKQLRLLKGLSQERMARMIDVSTFTYAKIERGAAPSRIFIEKTKRAFPEIDINSVFFNSIVKEA